MAKLQRWVDLLAALLRRRYPITLEELEQEVPGYRKIQEKAARRRAFERDKDELRRFGVPLETVQEDEVAGYRIDRKQFYLPYISVIRDAQPTPVQESSKPWYLGLRKLAFEADELEAIAEAALRVRRLGIPALTEFTGSAMRKLAFDLPTDVSVHEAAASYAVADAVSTVRAPAAPPLRRAIPQDELFELLDEALRRRKTVTITYHTMGSGRDGTRAVMPYGVFFLGHHWYLAARDSADGPVKNFRLSRIHDATLNTTRPGTPDYEIPAGFSLAEHARSRSAWELGDTATVEALVRFDGASGPTHAALRLGEPVEGEPRVRRFHVRRPDTFLRWLLSFAGEAEPVSPPELVSEYRELARRTLAAYAEAV